MRGHLAWERMLHAGISHLRKFFEMRFWSGKGVSAVNKYTVGTD